MNTTYLGNAGAIVPKDYYKIGTQNTSKYDKDVDYSVTFRITEACDLACNYCHWHGGRHYEFETIIKSIDVLFEFFKRQDFTHVVFYYHGGEATRHNRVVEILAHVKAKSAEYGIEAYNEMQTNLTVKEETLRAIVPYCDMLNISFHYLELKKRQYKLDAFIRNWKVLTDMGANVHNLDVMLEYMEPDMVQPFYQLVEGFLSYPNITNSEMVYCFGYNFSHNKATSTQHGEFYTKHNKTEQTYEIDGKEYTTNDLFNVGLDCTGWWCAAGVRSITINGDGNVYNCGIHMTNNLRNHPDAAFTNLATDPMAINKMSILQRVGTKCRWDYCGGDFYLAKRKSST